MKRYRVMLPISMSQLYNNVQISILGIAMVLGFFLIWRILRRIEERISSIPLCKCSPDSDVACFLEKKVQGGDRTECKVEKAHDDKLDHIDIADMVEEEMKEHVHDFNTIFHESPQVVVVSQHVPVPVKKSTIRIEEEPEGSDEPEQETTEQKALHDSDVHINKSKLQRMSVDALRDVASDMGLSNEGTKKQLLERIFAEKFGPEK